MSLTLQNNRTLICTVGLPRSGKTTWAKEQNMPIVNPDSIRLALHGQRFQALAEPFVWAIAQTMVRSLFLAGHTHVIVDATNTTEKRREIWKSDEWQTYWKIFDASADICKKRAIAMNDYEILPTIDRMAAQMQLPASEVLRGNL